MSILKKILVFSISTFWAISLLSVNNNKYEIRNSQNEKIVVDLVKFLVPSWVPDDREEIVEKIMSDYRNGYWVIFKQLDQDAKNDLAYQILQRESYSLLSSRGIKDDRAHEYIKKAAIIAICYGASPSVKVYGESSFLHYAVLTKDIDFVNLVLKQKPAIESKDTFNYTALFNARKIEIIELLVQHGANVKVLDNDKNSLLFNSIKRDHSIKVIEFYLKNKIDPNLKNKYGDTVLGDLIDAILGGYGDASCKKEGVEILDLLSKYGVNFHEQVPFEECVSYGTGLRSLQSRSKKMYSPGGLADMLYKKLELLEQTVGSSFKISQEQKDFYAILKKHVSQQEVEQLKN